ncbi:hypothetical protein RJ640_028274 [Escallonia rubra]|uniref:Transport inhibitor response 1 domain-containing protein n=1 Tax=Escallonia rubra TaxID=112253 RepID=A0AA88RNV7_9ASTE|nr:hypothetical protein RJ640_028274 [Escallonia rubra]
MVQDPKRCNSCKDSALAVPGRGARPSPLLDGIPQRLELGLAGLQGLVQRRAVEPEPRVHRQLLLRLAGDCRRRFPNIRSVTLKGKPRFSDFNLLPQNRGADICACWRFCGG